MLSDHLLVDYVLSNRSASHDSNKPAKFALKEATIGMLPYLGFGREKTGPHSSCSRGVGTHLVEEKGRTERPLKPANPRHKYQSRSSGPQVRTSSGRLVVPFWLSAPNLGTTGEIPST